MYETRHIDAKLERRQFQKDLVKPSVGFDR